MFHQKQNNRATSRIYPPLTIITHSHPYKNPTEELLSDIQINTLIKFERRTVKKENNSWFSDSDNNRYSIMLGLFLHLALYISSGNYDEFDDYPSNLWTTSISTRKLLLSYLWFVSFFIFLTPQISILFRSNDVLSLKEDEKKALRKITHAEVTEMTNEQLNATLHRIRLRQTQLLSNTSHKEIYQYFSKLENQLTSLPSINKRTYEIACFFELACWAINIAALVVDLNATPISKQGALPLSLFGFSSLYLSRLLNAFKIQNKKLSSILDDETMQILKVMTPELSRERVQSALWGIRKFNAKPVSDSMRLSFLRFAPSQQHQAIDEIKMHDLISIAP